MLNICLKRLCFLPQQDSMISVKTARLLPRKRLGKQCVVLTMLGWEGGGGGRRDKKDRAEEELFLAP